MNKIRAMAPVGNEVVDYDRENLALYAALLDADDAGQDWRNAARSVMKLDPARRDAEACWRSHLERARWIIGKGLATALVAFDRRATQH